MTTVMRIECWANGEPSPHDGQYVLTWNTDIENSTVAVIVTVTDPRQAHQFADAPEAWLAWKAVNSKMPARPWDGELNRPFCAYTIMTMDLEEALKQGAAS